MKFYIRLKELLKKSNYTVAYVAEQCGVSEYRIRHLMDHDAKEISREVLDKVCGFLVSHGVAKRSDVLNKLFVRSPERFWHLLSERSRITLCMGVRPPDDEHRDHVVIAADSILQANLLKRMTEASSAAPGKRREEKPAAQAEPMRGNKAAASSHQGRKEKPAAQVIDLRLVETWDRKDLDRTAAEVRAKADAFYGEFASHAENAALVLFGSIKSNPVIEHVLATSLKHGGMYVSEDECPRPHQRSCPFFVCYRTFDPQPPSVCGGRRLSQVDASSRPGIYFENADQSWELAPWTTGSESADSDDAALVFYRFEKLTERLELVMGGYSGRGTRCLAEFVRGDHYQIDEFWPPTISTPEIAVGAFVLKFQLEGENPKASGSPSLYQKIKGLQVVRIAEQALASRLALPAV